ncbi:hypothetical protein N7478_004969 [Penicillium angulare]|uniref:uncharacterized protein n=1 Tax=Penicillium angulare TaxID=116970 RepID=UPI00254053E1|nr:uncharacterized protein N7478_004969 [Penicillium angulare]KAJ5279597.1 hypothetical protein N7478_004969 [Penicillium angulare]
MPDIIDLISSDPQLPDSSHFQNAQNSSHQLPRRPSNSALISSDSIDLSLFTYDDFEKPLKKRRVSNEIPQPPPGRVATATTRPVPARVSTLVSSFALSDDDFSPPTSTTSTTLPTSRTTTSRTQSGKKSEYSEHEIQLSDHDIPISSPPELPSRNLPSGVSRMPFQPSAARNEPYDPSDIISLDDDDAFASVAARNGAVKSTQDSIEEFSDPFSVPGFAEMIGERRTGKTVFSSKTAQLLSSLSEKEKAAKKKPTSKNTVHYRNKTSAMEFANLSDEVDEPAAPRRPPQKNSTKISTEEKEAKAKARANAKAQKDRDREIEKERKQKLKEEKAKQKQLDADIAEVNKLKVDKKESTPEMIIDIESSLEEASVGNQTVEFMRRLGVEHTFFISPIPNVVKWRRKVKAKWNDSASRWEPCEPHIQHEKHVLCLVPAQDFVDMVIASPDGEERETLEMHVLKIRSAYPNHKQIYLIEGLTAWMRKNRNSRNRAYQAEVLRQYEQPPAAEPSTRGRGRGRKPKNKPETTPPVDDDTIEDALLTLQVHHGCLIHHTNAPTESAEWLKNFTEHISTIPYRHERMTGNDAAFCMDVGQVKTGEDNLDTFVKMLQEVNRVTASMAYGIAGQYPCVTDLVRGMRMHGPTMLEDVRKSANRNGGLTDSRIGPAASKRLYKVFTGLDPASTDV